ncbi:MAG: histidine kinase dimerization/phosphoacceptor domain -containing protein [Balneolales bacterium]
MKKSIADSYNEEVEKLSTEGRVADQNDGKVNILIIDDNKMNLFTMNSILENPDLNIVSCNSGKDGLRQLLKKEFAVILLDINMPVMDGYETAKLIRLRVKSEYTPIIFITAYNYSEMDVVMGYTHGAIDYVISPIQPDILRAKVQAFVDIYKKNRQLERQKKEIEVMRDQLEETVAKRTEALEAEIAVRKLAEQKIKDSLNEKEVLLAEIHHRVKNNMAIVSALLRLEIKNQKEEKLQNILKNCMSRIDSMAMIHEKLYKAESFSHLEFKDYIEDLINHIAYSYKSGMNKITVEIDVDEILINLNQAIPCALILNELLNNAYKHAFVDKKRGKILIKVDEENNHINFMVKDDGIGMPTDFKLGKNGTFGTQLVDILVRQLQAEMVILDKKDTKGTCVKISFPKPELSDEEEVNEEEGV